MSDDVECPYCGKDQEINHDDGFGYEEGVSHEQECGNCEKAFVFQTSISFYYESYKADCLNGSPHKWGKPRKLWFDEEVKKELWSRRCDDCDGIAQEFNPKWATPESTELTKEG